MKVLDDMVYLKTVFKKKKNDASLPQARIYKTQLVKQYTDILKRMISMNMAVVF